MKNIRITIGSLSFEGRLEDAKAPKTCAAFRKLLPLRGKLIQARWSGEAAWLALGDLDAGVGAENATDRPGPGEVLWYPKGVSETEIFVPYGECSFASKFGPLQGNHFLTIAGGAEQLGEMGRRVLWDGAQEIVFEE